MEAMSPEEIKNKLEELEGWVLDLREGTYITKEFQTDNWKRTIFVVNAIATLSEARWHHPDLEVSFKKVKVKLTTHEAGGITERDLALAREIDSMVNEILRH
jgi:4a-hydroxytetrahydrobiopterin dehydratase